MKKKIILSLSFLLLLCACFPIHASASQFTDLPATSWYYPAVEYAVTNGLFSGTSSTTFSPDTPMNRGMFVTVLGRLHQVTGTYGQSENSPFIDVKSTDYFAPYALWAKDNELVSGVDSDHFNPAGNITREQLVTILHRYFQKYGFPLAERNASFERFTDASTISSYASEPMHWAVAYGILGGANGKLNPQGQADRAQVAQMLLNFSNLEHYAASPEPTPEPEPSPTPVPDWQTYNLTYDIPTGKSSVDADGGYYDYDLANEIMRQIDELRVSIGAEPLKYNPKIQGWASIRAKEHSIVNGHTRPDGTPCLTVGSGLEAENLYRGWGFTQSDFDSTKSFAEYVVTGWYNSPGHCRSMLNSNYQLAAVSCYIQGDKIYIAHLFSTQSLYFMDFLVA